MMRRYLLAGFVLSSLCAQASENPFDLKTKLNNLEKDQNSILSELKKTDDTIRSHKQPAAENKINTDPQKISESSSYLSAEDNVKSTAPAENNITSSVTHGISEEEQHILKNIMAEAQQQASQKRLAEEKDEIEGSKKEDIVAQKSDNDEINEIIEMVASVEVQTKEVVETNESTPMPAEEIVSKVPKAASRALPQQSLLDDINITHEKQAEKEDADILYVKAVEEIDTGKVETVIQSESNGQMPTVEEKAEEGEAVSSNASQEADALLAKAVKEIDSGYRETGEKEAKVSAAEGEPLTPEVQKLKEQADRALIEAIKEIDVLE